MSRRLHFTLFAVVCLLQVSVPLSLIVRHELTRREGTPWRFQTAPVDPNDPFRGKYVRLAFAVEQDAVPMAADSIPHLSSGHRVYAELVEGPDGYARLHRVHLTRPQNVEYVDAFLRRTAGEGQPTAVYLRLPFDRYYLPEDKAPAVERAYRDASSAAQARSYVEVRVRDGHAALMALVLDGRPVTGEGAVSPSEPSA